MLYIRYREAISRLGTYMMLFFYIIIVRAYLFSHMFIIVTLSCITDDGCSGDQRHGIFTNTTTFLI